MIYLMPKTSGLPPEVLTLLSAAKVVVREPDTLWEAINKVELDAFNLIGLDENNFAVLLRHINTLLPELPTVVVNIPDVHYSSAFMMTASKVPAIDWAEFESKLAKTGLMATTKADLERSVAQDNGLEMMASVGDAVAHATTPANPSLSEGDDDDGVISFGSD